MTTATNYLTVEISADALGALQDAIVALAQGMDAENIAAIRIDGHACCAEMDITLAAGRRH